MNELISLYDPMEHGQLQAPQLHEEEAETIVNEAVPDIILDPSSRTGLGHQAIFSFGVVTFLILTGMAVLLMLPVAR